MNRLEMSDTEILDRIRGGEKELFRVIMDRYASLVFHVVRRYESDNEAMQERAHEIFLKTWERMESFRGESEFSSWLYRLAHNHCLDQHRRRTHHNEFFTELPGDFREEMKDTNPGPDSILETGDRAEALWKALRLVGDDYAVPLLMKYRDGMSYEDISEDLNVPVGALKVRVHRARRQLKQHLENLL
jgi:RNA polymerase sigma-70 factor, ECF subfamily